MGSQQLEAEPGQTGPGNSDQFGDPSGLKTQIPLSHMVFEERSGEIDGFDAQAASGW